jgi:hypothetical protein
MLNPKGYINFCVYFQPAVPIEVITTSDILKLERELELERDDASSLRELASLKYQMYHEFLVDLFCPLDYVVNKNNNDGEEEGRNDNSMDNVESLKKKISNFDAEIEQMKKVSHLILIFESSKAN